MVGRKRTISYKLIPHPSDLCIRVIEPTLKKLFNTGALALFDQFIYKVKVGSKVFKSINVKAPDRDLLFVYWLQELLYQFYVFGLTYHNAKINKLTSTEIRADVTFTKFNPQTYRIKREVKAVTHHNVNIQKQKNEYAVQFVIDV